MKVTKTLIDNLNDYSRCTYMNKYNNYELIQ